MTKKKQPQGELIYGVNPLIECLKAKRRKVIQIYTTRPTPKAWSKIEKYLPERPIPIQYVDRQTLDKLSNTPDHQNIVAWVGDFPFRSKMFDPLRHKALILLDGIQDTRNLGAILRSAYCTGIDGVVIVRRFAAPLNAAAIKASAGLAEHLEIMTSTSAVEAAQAIKAAGYQLYVTTFDGENATEVQFREPLCVVIGSEGEGVSPTLAKIGTKVTLPQREPDISYNASVAAGILLFLIGTQRDRI